LLLLESARGRTLPYGDRVRLPVLAVFVLAPLHTFPEAGHGVREKTHVDRALVGRALAGLDGTMLTSESGAPPYYSGWRSVDTVGLTSEEIAHRGMSLDLMRALDPDLILLLNRPTPGHAQRIRRYLLEADFVAVAATRKYRILLHFLFVRRSSPRYDEIVERLLNIDGVDYADLDAERDTPFGRDILEGVPLLQARHAPSR
jgi:hypothetical protein